MKWQEKFPPSYFSEYIPPDPNGYSAENKIWSNNQKFTILAKVFGEMLTTSAQKALKIPMPLPAQVPEYASNRVIEPIGRSGLVLSANGTTSGSGVFTSKRYVRLSPLPYHANSCQLFIEAYMSGAQHDRNARDPSDAEFKKFGFPVPDGHIGLTIGCSVILHSEGFDFSHPNPSEKWTLSAAVLDGDKDDFDQICEEFDDFGEVVQMAAQQMNPQAPAILDGRVARVRIRLPDLSLASDDWNDCGVLDKLEELCAFICPVLVKSC